MAGRMFVLISTHRTSTVVKGNGSPTQTNKKNGIILGKLDERI
jgi:hypothetical protein